MTNRDLGVCVVLATIVAASTLSLAQGPAYDLLLTNARIVDGTGNPWYAGSLP